MAQHPCFGKNFEAHWNLSILKRKSGYSKTGKSTLRWPFHLSKASFDKKCGVKNFELVSVFQCLGYLGLVSPNLV